MQKNRTVDGAARKDGCFIAMDDKDQAKLEHVFHSLDIRHAATGCVRDCSSLLGQLRIRAVLANHRTSNIDLSVFRKFIASIVAAGQVLEDRSLVARPIDLLPGNTGIPDWFMMLSMDKVKELNSELEGVDWRSMHNQGKRDIGGDSQCLPVNPVFPDRNARIRVLAGLPESGKADLTIKDTWSRITLSHLECLIDALPEGDEIEGFVSVFNDGKRHPGIVRLLARVAWLTGMRSIELYTCRLNWMPVGSVSSDSSAMTDYPVEDNAGAGPRLPLPGKCTTGHVSRAIREIEHEYGDRTAVLRIRSAKTGCHSGRIDNLVRIQLLTSLAIEDLGRIWMASRLRQANLASTRIRSTCDYCSRVLVKYSKQVFPERVHPINLHMLRHAFIDTCRRSMPIEEAAVLSGHTCVRSTRHYGGKHARYSARGSRDRWMPQPLQTEVRLAREAWKKHEPGSTPCVRDQGNDLELEPIVS